MPGPHLAFVGMTTMDVVQVCDELPVPNQKGTARHSYVDVGGPAANAAITASILGSPVVLHSVTRAGVLGQTVDELIDQYGVARFDHGPAHAVPVSSIWVTATGERTILSTAVAGVSDQPSTPDVELDGVAAVLLDGFYPHLALRAGTLAAERRVPIVLDCGSWRDVFHALLPLATVAIVSEHFALPSHETPSPESTAAALGDEFGLELAAVSRGERPIVWRTPTAAGEMPVPNVQAIDTLGAGDVLHGAFMYFAYHRGLDLLDALERAAVVASRSCAHYGTRTGVQASVGTAGPVR